MITTILPTTCQRPELLRAIESAQGSRVVVVVNGDRYDPALFERVKGLATVTYLPGGNVSAARFHGLRYVETPFFGFLDDDDEYLPGWADVRAAAMDSGADVIVTNGYQDGGLLVEDPPAVRADPLGSFVERNWFASPASLFRAETVPPETFDFRLRHYEWTWLFFLLHTQGKRIEFIDAPTWRVHSSAGSASKSEAYHLALPAFLADLEALPLPPEVIRALRRKRHAALNSASNFHLAKGEIGKSAACHARCLASGGWRYLPYTRVIVANLLKA